MEQTPPISSAALSRELLIGYSVLKCAAKACHDLFAVVGMTLKTHTGSWPTVGSYWKIDPK